VLLRLGEYGKAVDSFKDSIRRIIRLFFPITVMALAYNKLERFGDAAEMMDRAIMIDPGYQGNRDKKVADMNERLYSQREKKKRTCGIIWKIMQY